MSRLAHVPACEACTVIASYSPAYEHAQPICTDDDPGCKRVYAHVMDKVYISGIGDAYLDPDIEEDGYCAKFEMPEREIAGSAPGREKTRTLCDVALRLRNFREKDYHERNKEDGHYGEEYRVGIFYRMARMLPHKRPDDKRDYSGGQGIEGASYLDELVTPVASSSDRVEHRVHHGIEHTHGKAGHECTEKVYPEIRRQPGNIKDTYTGETYPRGNEGRHFVSVFSEEITRRQTHEGICHKVDEISELRPPVTQPELEFDYYSERILKPCHKRDHEKKHEHDHNCRNIFPSDHHV